jgi:Zn-dependent protease
MGRSTRLGRLFDMDVWVDWSGFVAFGGGALTLLGVAPRVLPAMPPGELGALALLAALGAFGALCLHEIARDLAARACGVRVRHVTLFLFGAVTDVDAHLAARGPAGADGDTSLRSRWPDAEIASAAVATGVSALTGAVLLGAARMLSSDLERGGPANALLAWLGVASLVVAATNVLPAYPLDGGRVLRAIVWRATGDIERATRIAAWSAEAIGWCALVVGASLVFALHDLAMACALWVALGGWFLACSAARAYECAFTPVHEG